MRVQARCALLLISIGLAGCGGNAPVVVNRTSGPGHGDVGGMAPTGGQGQPSLISNGTGPVAGPLTSINVR